MGRDVEEMRREWNLGMTGIVPAKPGYYWIFVQHWKMCHVGRRSDGALWDVRLRQLVSKIYPDRWGPMFSEEV